MRLLFINQYGPPDSPPTARLLDELADFLGEHGHVVEILAQTQIYQSRPAKGGGRMRRELGALWFLLRIGWRRRSPCPDLILSLSSPPGLLVVAAILAWWHQAYLVHWAMDLYPELALALDEIPPGFLARTVGRAMRWAYRRSALVIALDEDMRAHLQLLCRNPVQILEPWPSRNTEKQLSAALTALPPVNQETWTWLYSGNLGRAHEWRILLDAQRILEDRDLPIRLVFQGDGAARFPAQEYARGLDLRRCEWHGYVLERDLLHSLQAAGTLIVTQRPETRGLLWPSKLAVLERLSRPLLFVGPVDGAIAQRLRARGYAGIFEPGQTEAVADWIEAQFRQPAAATTVVSTAPGSQQACQTLENWLLALV